MVQLAKPHGLWPDQNAIFLRGRKVVATFSPPRVVGVWNIFVYIVNTYTNMIKDLSIRTRFVDGQVNGFLPFLTSLWLSDRVGPLLSVYSRLCVWFRIMDHVLAWLLPLLGIREMCGGRGKQSVCVQVTQTKENIVKLSKHTQAETIWLIRVRPIWCF